VPRGIRIEAHLAGKVFAHARDLLERRVGYELHLALFFVDAECERLGACVARKLKDDGERCVAE
jgi:hypothetical protein